jgi:hypothetical protein
MTYRYRRSFRYSRPATAGQKAAAAVAAALLLGAGGTAAHHHRHPGGWHGSVPDGSAYTPVTWGRAFLRGGRFPVTSANVTSMVAWENREGGAWSNSAERNPLNTAQTEPGSWAMNDIGNGLGVQAFPSWREGFQANLTALFNGNYPDLIAALKSGNGLCGYHQGFATWSGGGYPEIC